MFGPGAAAAVGATVLLLLRRRSQQRQRVDAAAAAAAAAASRAVPSASAPPIHPGGRPVSAADLLASPMLVDPGQPRRLAVFCASALPTCELMSGCFDFPNDRAVQPRLLLSLWELVGLQSVGERCFGNDIRTLTAGTVNPPCRSQEWPRHHRRDRGPWSCPGASWVRAGVRRWEHRPHGHRGPGSGRQGRGRQGSDACGACCVVSARNRTVAPKSARGRA